MFSRAVRPPRLLKPLEHEPDRVETEAGKRRVAKRGDILPVDRDRAFRGPV